MAKPTSVNADQALDNLKIIYDELADLLSATAVQSVARLCVQKGYGCQTLVDEQRRPT